MVVVVDVLLFEIQRAFSHWFTPQMPIKIRARPGHVWNSSQSSHFGGRNPSSWVITCCLPEGTGAGSWIKVASSCNWMPRSWHLQHWHPMGLPGPVLATVANWVYQWLEDLFPEDLNHLLLFSQAMSRGARSELEQPGCELAASIRTPALQAKDYLLCHDTSPKF